MTESPEVAGDYYSNIAERIAASAFLYFRSIAVESSYKDRILVLVFGSELSNF